MEQQNKIKSFKDLIAWQEAHALALLIYKWTKSFPTSEKFGLTSQIQRAAVSVSSNIAEGFSRISSKEKINFYYNALGSLTETQNQLLLAKDLLYINTESFNQLDQQTIVVSKLINGLIKHIKQANIPNT